MAEFKAGDVMAAKLTRTDLVETVEDTLAQNEGERPWDMAKVIVNDLAAEGVFDEREVDL